MIDPVAVLQSILTDGLFQDPMVQEGAGVGKAVCAT